MHIQKCPRSCLWAPTCTESFHLHEKHDFLEVGAIPLSSSLDLTFMCPVLVKFQQWQWCLTSPKETGWQWHFHCSSLGAELLLLLGFFFSPLLFLVSIRNFKNNDLPDFCQILNSTLWIDAMDMVEGEHLCLRLKRTLKNKLSRLSRDANVSCDLVNIKSLLWAMEISCCCHTIARCKSRCLSCKLPMTRHPVRQSECLMTRK